MTRRLNNPLGSSPSIGYRTPATNLDPRPFAVRRFWLFLGLCGLIIGVLLVIHIIVGTVELTPRQVVDALFNRQTDELHRQVVWGLRLPRALIAILAGAMLGLAGAILQTVTRNPLAEPGLLGVSSGAVLAVVLWITVLSKLQRLSTIPDAGLVLPIVAFGGGMLTELLVYGLSWRRGSDPIRLVLTGVLVGGMCSAFTSVFLLWADEYSVTRILRWTIGSTSGRVWVHWHTIWPVALVSIAAGFACAGWANALQLGDSVAAGLGLRVERTRILLLTVSALLTAGAVAVVGAISFIGLIGPHLARQLVGGDVRRLFPTSVLCAAMLLLVSDILARTLTIGWVGWLTGLAIPDVAGLPVGAVTALLGAPFFLYLLLNRRA